MTVNLALQLRLNEIFAELAPPALPAGCPMDACDAGRPNCVANAMPLFALSFALLGIALGTPAGELRSKLGDPLLVEAAKVSRTADYLRGDDPSAVLRVTERDGVVSAVEIERERPEASPGAFDGHGVFVGMSRLTVLTKRGKPAFETMNTLMFPENADEDASLIYRFDGDTLESIKLVGSGGNTAGSPALPPLSEATGDSYGAAILDLTPSVSGSDHFRERYLSVHACAPSGRHTTIDRRDGRTFAVITSTCKDKARTLYFDITRARP